MNNFPHCLAFVVLHMCVAAINTHSAAPPLPAIIERMTRCVQIQVGEWRNLWFKTPLDFRIPPTCEELIFKLDELAENDD